MIPKIVHFCWLGEGDYPDYVKNCIESWKECLPDYEIMLWDTQRFDVNITRYTKEAFQERKYAFASDYVRLYALYNHGGIYLDSDIKVIKKFDDLLNNKGFTGFEDKGRIAAWIFGSEPGNPLFKEFMDHYADRPFIMEDGKYDLTPNPVPITNILNKKGLSKEDTIQYLEDITVYPMTYFCPYNPYRESGDCFTDNTYAIHLFNGAWKDEELKKKEKKYKERKDLFVRFFGKKWGARINRKVNTIIGI